MTASTPILGLRYPVDTDAPGTLGVHTAIQNLANDLDQYFGAWTSWTPQVDQGATTNISKTVNNARYRVQGKLCEFEYRITMVGTGTASNKVTISTPQNHRVNGFFIVGWGWIFDSSSTAGFRETVWIDSGVNNKFVYRNGAGLLGAATFTAALGINDVLEGIGFMELA